MSRRKTTRLEEWEIVQQDLTLEEGDEIWLLGGQNAESDIGRDKFHSLSWDEQMSLQADHALTIVLVRHDEGRLESQQTPK